MAFDSVLYDDVIAAFTVDANHLREMAAKIVEGGRDALFRRRMPYACDCRARVKNACHYGVFCAMITKYKY